MIFYQILTVTITTIVFGILIAIIAKEYKTRLKHFMPVFALLLCFSLGFMLRLSQEQSMIDLGFFFTEMSGIFGTILFTSALLLGQMKYHKLE